MTPGITPRSAHKFPGYAPVVRGLQRRSCLSRGDGAFDNPKPLAYIPGQRSQEIHRTTRMATTRREVLRSVCALAGATVLPSQAAAGQAANPPAASPQSLAVEPVSLSDFELQARTRIPPVA